MQHAVPEKEKKTTVQGPWSLLRHLVVWGEKKNTSFKRIQQQQKKMEAAAFWMPIQRWYLEIHPGSHHFISKVSQENHPCFNHPNLWQDFDVQKAAAQ